MALYPRRRRGKYKFAPGEVNLVSARSAVYTDVTTLSRDFASANYSRIRLQRQRNRRIVAAVCVVLIALVVSSATALSLYLFVIKPWNASLHTSDSGATTDFSSGVYEGVFDHPVPDKPFYVLLLGTDGRDPTEAPRSDTIILVRVDPIVNEVAMISIPRDSLVNIPGHGNNKINAAYAFGAAEHNKFIKGESNKDNSGPAMAVRTVHEFAGVPISYFAEIDFEGFKKLVDGIGGVKVDVPVAIIGDHDAGGIDIHTGKQVLNGEQALVFVRSRNFPMGDYQRQADQRTFLQAMAAQVLSSDVVSIRNTINGFVAMTYTNMSVEDIVAISLSMRGMQPSAIHTYTVPSHTQTIDGISYVVVDDGAWKDLIKQIDSGIYPSVTDDGLLASVPNYANIYAVTPYSYQAPDDSGAPYTGISPDQAAVYMVDVRNGAGITGAATAVSDKLNLAGYRQGEVGNTDLAVYETTFVIYKDEGDKVAADDIASRLGFGKVIPSLGRYSFNGNVLVVIGADYPQGGE
ncbi:MAG: LCP family protein [Actinomycetia bacterium]|nr:LCP family protein [Actinomycetes bacterium]